MIVNLEQFPDDHSFSVVRRFKLGNVEITIEATSGDSAMPNVDIINFRRAVDAMENLVPVVEP